MLNPSLDIFAIKEKISEVNEEKIIEFKKKLFSRGFITGICIGNILENEVRTIFNDNFKQIIKYKAVNNFDELYEYKL